MAINVSQAFHRTSANPVDESLALTKAQMVSTNDNLMPSKYLTVCQDDGKIYLYDKTVESTVETGRFRVFEGGSTITVDPTPTENSTNAVQSGGTYTALAGKVDKVQGKGLSTEDYTTAEKTKLSGIATDAEKNTIVGITVNGDAITPDANRIAALTVLTNTVNNLLNYYNKTETYSKTEVDTLVSAVAGATFESVQTLPTTNIKTNVIYLVPKQTPETNNIKDEYINLDGTTAGWELIGDTGVDLSNYVTTTALNTALGNYTTTADLTTLLAGKVDKVSGKQLSTEDYTTAEKTKLSGLSNYDDTALSGRVSAIEGVVPSTATTSNKLATMSDVASGGAHTIEDSTGVDMTARKNLQFVGAAVSDDSTNNRTVVTVNVSGKADKVASAVSGNFAGLDANGNITDSGKKASDFGTASDVAGKEDKFRYTTMPTASVDYVGKIVQYIGESIQNSYQNGYYYQCVNKSGAYTWVEKSVGSAFDKRIDDSITNIKVVYDNTASDYRFISYVSFDIVDLMSKETLTMNDIYYVFLMYQNGEITEAEFNSIMSDSGLSRIDFAYSMWKNGTFSNSDFVEQWEIADVSFADATGKELADVADVYYNDGITLEKINTKWNIGDKKVINISAMPEASPDSAHNAEECEFAIMDFNHDTLTTAINGKTKALFALGMTDLFSWTGKMHTAAASNWANVARRTWCNNTCLNALPSDFRSGIKQVTKTAYGSSTTQDKVFLPSAKEVIGSWSYSEGGSQYAYYASNTKVKKRNGSAEIYLTRSHDGAGESNNSFVVITKSGGRRGDPSYATTAYGQHIMFCI